MSEELKKTLMAELGRHPFKPAWWLPGAHVQTVWPALFRKRPSLPPVRKSRIETPDGDFVDTWVQPGRPDAPIILLLHGLEGSFDSPYITGMHAAIAATGWTAITLEHRSCGSEMNRARRMYHMGETSDLDFVARDVLQRPGVSRLYVVGYSLGGNVAAKWFGEQGEALPAGVAGGAAISAPYDLSVSAPYMDRRIMRPYRFKFLRSLKKKAVLKNRQYPGIVDIGRVLKCKTYEEFDTLATAPFHGFKDAADYWKQTSCGQFLENVRRPLLLVSAENDPFIQGFTFPVECASQSPYLFPLLVPEGGHVGFVHGSLFRPRFWAEEQTLRFFLAVENHLR